MNYIHNTCLLSFYFRYLYIISTERNIFPTNDIVFWGNKEKKKIQCIFLYLVFFLGKTLKKSQVFALQHLAIKHNGITPS